MKSSGSQLTVVSFAERPELAEELPAAIKGGWPEFIFHDPVAKRHIARVWELFTDLNLVLLWPHSPRAGTMPSNAVSATTTAAQLLTP